jgi:hypothetical protein
MKTSKEAKVRLLDLKAYFLSCHITHPFFVCTFRRDRILEDGKIYLIEILLWYCNSAAASFENSIQSLVSESLPFTDKPAGRCCPDKEATII